MVFISCYETKKASYYHITSCNHMERDRLPPLFSLPFLIIISSLTLRIWLFTPLHCFLIDTLIIFKTVTSIHMNTKFFQHSSMQFKIITVIINSKIEQPCLILCRQIIIRFVLLLNCCRYLFCPLLNS